MPRAKQYAPGSLSSRIRLWLLDNPGAHRPRDVAAGLGIPEGVTKSRWTVMVGRELNRMADRFQTVERVPGDTMAKGGVPASTYRLPQQDPPT